MSPTIAETFARFSSWFPTEQALREFYHYADTTWGAGASQSYQQALWAFLFWLLRLPKQEFPIILIVGTIFVLMNEGDGNRRNCRHLHRPSLPF
jgi:hypothetical protein